MSHMTIIGLIYNRCLTIKDGEFDDSAAMTLMSNDADQIMFTADLFHEIWSQTLELCIGTYLLAKELGWTCIVPLAIVLCKLLRLSSLTFKLPLRLSDQFSCFPGHQICYCTHCESTKGCEHGNTETHLNN
jgi:ATP-binding cassette subfamily C (CFTR/MRP) protein 1